MNRLRKQNEKHASLWVPNWSGIASTCYLHMAWVNINKVQGPNEKAITKREKEAKIWWIWWTWIWCCVDVGRLYGEACKSVTYKAIASTLSRCAIGDDHRFVDLAVFLEKLAQRVVRCVVRQAAHKYLRECGVLLVERYHFHLGWVRAWKNRNLLEYSMRTRLFCFFFYFRSVSSTNGKQQIEITQRVFFRQLDFNLVRQNK